MKHVVTSFYLLLLLHLVNVQGTNAQTWQPVPSQPTASKFTGLHVSKTSSALVISTLDKGIYRSTNGGVNWQQTAFVSDSIFTLTAQNESTLYAGAKGAIFRSLDSGKTWTRHAFPHPVALGCMVFHPSGKLVVGTGSIWDYNNSIDGKGMWYSEDSAKTWKELNTGIPKVEPRIESLAIGPDGTLLAGIYDQSDFGTDPKHGVMYLESFAGSWQRAHVSVKGPSNLSYSDDKLEIEHVYHLSIVNGNVYASVAGVYVNYATAFTMIKPYSELKNPVLPWQVKWLKDSIASDGSYYELITTLFEDSKHNYWASVSSSSYTTNEIYQGQLATNTGWASRLDGLRKTLGCYLFGEDGKGIVYTTDYFLGDTLYSRPLPDVVASLEHSNKYFSRLSLAPNPAKDQIRLNWYGHSLGSVKLSLINMTGLVVKEEEVNMHENYTMTLPEKPTPSGVYLLKITEGDKTQSLRVLVIGE